MSEWTDELKDLEKYACDANTGMSEFQIEHFIVNSEPPIGRYSHCCVEIQARVNAAKALTREISSCADALKKESLLRRLRDILREAHIFANLAERWKPAMRGLSFHELQPEYWDERLGRELCLRLVTGQAFGDLVKPIMSLEDSSRAKRLLLNCRSAPADTEDARTILASIEDGKWLLQAPETTDTK